MELIILDNISIIVKLNDEVSFEEMDDEGFFYNEKNEKLIVANTTTLYIYNFIKNNIEKNIDKINFSSLFNSIKKNFHININDNVLLYDIIKTLNDLDNQEIIIIENND